MQRLMMSFLLLAMVVMTGCMIPSKTQTTKDGFMARQKTTSAHRAIVEGYDVYQTDCRWDQQMKDKDGAYYCPPPGTKEAYDSHVYLAQYMESVIDKYGPEAFRAGALIGSAGLIRSGLRGSSSHVTQSVNGAQTQTNIPVFESPGAVIH